MVEFKEFPKIPRFNREIVITEKIDGTNASIWITPVTDGALLEGGTREAEDDTALGFKKIGDDGLDYVIRAGSRNRFLSRKADNFGFAKFVEENADALFSLGAGTHYGEWAGSGIQRGYGYPPGQKEFFLFNTYRWSDVVLPEGVRVVPLLYQGPWFMPGGEFAPQFWLKKLEFSGSSIAPFRNPEGIVVLHTQSRHQYKITVHDDEKAKGQV